MNENLRDEHNLLYGPRVPSRAARVPDPTCGPSDTRLCNTADLKDINAASSASESLTWACTPLIEVGPDGSQLEARPYAGLVRSHQDRLRHVGIIGSTGSGKTYCFAVSQVDGTLKQTSDSVACVNTKGPVGTEEIRAVVRAHCPDTEFIVFAPGNRERSTAIQLLAAARRMGLVALVTRYICESVPRGHGDSAFWEAIAKRVITEILGFREIETLAQMHEVLSSPATMRAIAKKTGSAVLLRHIDFSASGANGATSGVDMPARSAPVAASETVRAITSGPDELDIAGLLRSSRRFVLVIEANEAELEDYKHIIGLFWTLFIATAVKVAEESGGRLKRGLSAFMDEFGILPKMLDAVKTFNLARSRGMCFYVFVQTIDQIYATYGAEAPALLAALCTKVFFCSGLSPADRAYASNLSGTITVREWKHSETIDPHTDEWRPSSRCSQVVHRPLITSEDMQLRPHPVFGGYAYVFPVDQPPVLVHFTPAWEIPRIAHAIETARASKPLQRETPLPIIAATGLLVNWLGPTSDVDESDVPFPRGTTPKQMKQRLTDARKLLGFSAATRPARKWWRALEQQNLDKLPVLLALTDRLRSSNATIQEFYEAYVRSNTESFDGVIHFMNYERIKKREAEIADEAAKRKHASSAASTLQQISGQKAKLAKPGSMRQGRKCPRVDFRERCPICGKAAADTTSGCPACGFSY